MPGSFKPGSGDLSERLTITVKELLAVMLVVALLFCQSLLLTHNHLDEGAPVAPDCELCVQLTGAGHAAASPAPLVAFEPAVTPRPEGIRLNLTRTLRYQAARGPPATA